MCIQSSFEMNAFQKKFDEKNRVACSVACCVNIRRTDEFEFRTPRWDAILLFFWHLAGRFMSSDKVNFTGRRWPDTARLEPASAPLMEFGTGFYLKLSLSKHFTCQL